MLLLAIPRSSSSSSGMKIIALTLMFGASLAFSAPSTFSTTTLPKQFQSGALQTSGYYGPSIYPGYYLYNYLQIDPGRGLPFAIFGDGSQNVAHIQPTYTYFGTPLYDHRYIFNQVFPSLPGFQPPAAVPGVQPPMIPPSQVPIYPTQPPFEDDGIEKLDEKLDPSLEGTTGGHPNDDVDTVTVDAI